MSPTISIVIPALNEEKFIGNLLNDAFSGSFTDFEVIVSDNGSNDGTVALVREYSARKKNVRIVSSAKKGPSCARNFGASFAKGEYILFLDADVRVDADFLDCSLIEMKKRKIDVAGYLSVPDSDRLIDKVVWFFFNNIVSELCQIFFPISPIGGGIVLTKRVIHNEIGGFDESMNMSEDHDYVRRSSKHGKFRILRTTRAIASMRRFEREGRTIVWAKWFVGGACYLFGINNKRPPFSYEFGVNDPPNTR